MFGAFPKSELQIIAPDGTVRSTESGLVDGKLIIVPNGAAVIQIGDEIRRKLPNGIEESFEVIDPVYYNGLHGIPPHYQVKIRRKGSIISRASSDHYTLNVSGSNARVNIASHDHSHNVVSAGNVFIELKAKIETDISDLDERARLLALVETMEKSINNRPSFTTAYQNFISSAANHMTLIAPFLPAITNLLG